MTKPKHVVRIRHAAEDDAALIVAFIEKLAAYQGLATHASPDVEQLSSQLRQRPRRVHCLIAEIEGHPVGFALYFFRYRSFRTSWEMHLEDIYVDEAHRRTGVGGGIFRVLAHEALLEGCQRIDFSVLRQNTSAISAYQKLGAVSCVPEWQPMRIEETVLSELAQEPPMFTFTTSLPYNPDDNHYAAFLARLRKAFAHIDYGEYITMYSREKKCMRGENGAVTGWCPGILSMSIPQPHDDPLDNTRIRSVVDEILQTALHATWPEIRFVPKVDKHKPTMMGYSLHLS